MVRKDSEDKELKMHTIQLKLKTTSYDEQQLVKRFYAISHIHNVLVKHAKKCLKKLGYDKDYQHLKDEYIKFLKATKDKKKLTKEENAYKKQLSDSLNGIVRSYGLSEYSFQSYIKVCGEQFRKCVSSLQVQKEATRVWSGVREYIYGKGKNVHFKKYEDFDTIGGKNNTNGAKFDKDTLTVSWLGLELKCKLPKDSTYAAEALSHDIKYCDIKRMMFDNGWHYYVIIYLDGDAPHKIQKAGDKYNTMGIDIGTSTIAAVSEDKVILRELAPDSRDYNKKIIKLQRQLDTSRRMSNPSKYDEDGTCKKGNHDKWKFSKSYFKKKRRLKTLYRKKSAYIKQSHEELTAELLSDSIYFIVEDMSFKGLQKKSAKTERQEKLSDVKNKDGTVRRVHKYKRKKRFGHSLNNRAPAELIAILTRKAEMYGGDVYKVRTKDFKASQYDHTTGECVKHKLVDRIKQIGGHTVQRDLYSAFLLRNSNTGLTAPDRDKCIYGFDDFLKMQDGLIDDMKQKNISMKWCFGF